MEGRTTGLSKMRSEKSPINSLYKDAVDAFKTGSFQKSASFCQAILNVSPNDLEATRLLAHSPFKLEHYMEALEEYKIISSTASYQDEAEWHIMLCHKALSAVDAGQYELYLLELRKLANEGDSRFKPKARKLLQQELSSKKKK